MNIENHLRTLLVATCKTYDVPTPLFRLSGKLKKSNGICRLFYTYGHESALRRAQTPQEVLNTLLKCEITISKHITEIYSIKTAEETLLHEIAHYLDYIFNKNFGHGNSFKEICVAIGGTMNSSLATGEFSEAATAEFVSSKIGYLYECGCGRVKMKRLKKFSAKSLTTRRCPSCGTYRKDYKITEL